jgi:uncharacterized protein
MRLNLDDLGLRGGEQHVCTYTVEVAPVSLGGERYEVLVPEGVSLAIERIAGGYLVGLSMDAWAYGPCSRCLKEATLQVHAEQEEFAPTAVGGWAESESSAFIEDLVVDVSGLAREALVLAIPDKILCSVECRGLCPQCGADLNCGRCGCGPLEISAPMR